MFYDYAISNTIPPTVLKPEELDISYQKNEGNYTKSKLELLMEMRDAKRRRTSYRSKKVHTNRKSHVEILREVIQKQMEYLQELHGKEGEEEEEEEEAEAEHSWNDNINIKQGNVETDANETRKTNSSVSNLLNVADSSSENLRAGSYDSHEYLNKEKVLSRNEPYGEMTHNKHHKRINAYANHEKYEEHSTSGNYYNSHSGSRKEEINRNRLQGRHFREFPFESHSGNRSDYFREGKYKQHHRSRNFNDFPSDDHSGYRCDSRREERYEKSSGSRNLYEYPFDSHSENRRREPGPSKRKRQRAGSSEPGPSKRKRHRAGSSDRESPVNMGSRKKEYPYLRSESSKYHEKCESRHRTHYTHDNSFSRSEKKPKVEVKKEEEGHRESRRFYEQEIDSDDDSQYYHDARLKFNLLKQIFARSDSESSEISCDIGNPNTDTSEDDCMSHKEEYAAPHYYSLSNHISESDNVKKEHHKKKKHHKKKTKKKYKVRKSSESRVS